MKMLTLTAYFCIVVFGAADEQLLTNKAGTSASVNGATNQPGKTPEERLLAVFPQLLWTRTKLEFMFEQRAKMALALEAGANSDDEALKLAKDMKSVFTKDDDVKMFTEGWKMSGRVHSETVNFSKTNYTLAGIAGENQLLFDRAALISFSLWTDGSDTDFAKLYQVLIRACGSSGDRTIRDKNWSEINWTITGRTNRYNIQLSHRKWENSGESERGMTIFVKHPPFDDVSGK
jgi:hypothetical protein